MDHSIRSIDVEDDSVSTTTRTAAQHRQFVQLDRPPRSPVRTTSKKVPQFTRSRVFPSIRRKRKLPIAGISIFKNTTTTKSSRCQISTTVWIRISALWAITLLTLLSIYIYNVQKILMPRLLRLQPQHQSMNQTINADLTSAFPSIATNFDSRRQRLTRKRRQYKMPENLKYHSTNNNIASRYNGTVPRTKEDRIAPLLELIDRSLMDGTFITNWTSHIFKNIHRLPGRTPSDSDGNIRSCIVTAYFKLPSSKHHMEQYDQWMQNMLSMHDCMVIYCETDMVSTILQYRSSAFGNATTATIRETNHTDEIKYFGPTAIIEISLNDLPISKYYSNMDASPLEFWNRQIQMDPERKLHKSYELFWIWLSKSWFVTTAAVLQHYLFTSRNLNATAIGAWMWADIGSFRGTEYMNQQLIQQHEQIIPDNDTVLWMAHRKPNPPSDPYWNRKLLKKEKQHFYHSGSQGIANGVTAWINFHTHFVHALDEYASKDLFIGEDQCVLQTTCLLYPKSCAYVPSNQVHDNKYFGLRHVVRYGITNITDFNQTNNMFQLWRPPLRQPIDATL